MLTMWVKMLYTENSLKNLYVDIIVVVVCIEYPIERNLPFHQSDQEVQGDQVVHCHPKKQMNKQILDQIKLNP